MPSVPVTSLAPVTSRGPDGSAVPAPWARACARLGAELGRLLIAPGMPRFTVAPLGVRDEFRAAPGAEPAAGEGPGAARRVPVHLAGRQVIVGPLGRRSCARCLARRWQRARGRLMREALELGGPPRAVGDPPQVTPFGAAAVAALAAEHLGRALDAGSPAAGDGQRDPFVYQIDLENLRVLRARLLPDPDCPACGRPGPGRTAAALELRPAPRSRPGSLRTADLADIDLPVDALVNPVCGIVGPAARPEIDLPTTSAASGAFAEHAGGDVYELYWGGHAERYDLSVRTGLMEGLERYAGVRPRGGCPAVVAALDDLAEPALDPRHCGVYAPEFYQQDPQAQPFSSRREIPWVAGYSLRDHRPILVPQVLTYYHSAPRQQRFVQECSNGCASGSSLAEAILFGLMELIERDAFLLAWHGRAALPELDPRTSQRAGTRHLVERLAMYGYRARFFDTRMTFPVPVVTAVAVRTAPGLGTLCFGAGASLDPEAALAASLAEIATDALRARRRTERAQARLREMVTDFGKVRSLHDHPLLYGLPQMARHAAFLLRGAGPALSLAAAFAPDPARRGEPGDDIRDDLAHCVRLLAEAGFDTIVVDQTAPEQRQMGLHTASVIVPGLVPLDFGWSRQRVLHSARLRAIVGADGPNLAPHPFP